MRILPTHDEDEAWPSSQGAEYGDVPLVAFRGRSLSTDSKDSVHSRGRFGTDESMEMPLSEFVMPGDSPQRTGSYMTCNLGSKEAWMNRTYAERDDFGAVPSRRSTCSWVAELACLGSVYMAASCGMGILMKHMFCKVPLVLAHSRGVGSDGVVHGLPAPFLWTSTQQLVAFLLSVCMVLLHSATDGRCGHRPRALESPCEWVQVGLLALLFTFNIGLNNFSLSLVSLTVNNIIRATNPFWTATATALLVGNKVRFEQWVLMILGVTFAAVTVLISGHDKDKVHTGDGFGLGALAALVSILCGGTSLVIVERIGASSTKLNAVDSTCYLSLPSAILLAPLLFGVPHVIPPEWESHAPDLTAGAHTDVEIFSVVENTVQVWSLFIVSGLCAMGYNMLQFLMVQRLSPVTTALTSNLSKAITVLVSELYLEKASSSVHSTLIIISSLCVVFTFMCFTLLRVDASSSAEHEIKSSDPVMAEMRRHDIRLNSVLLVLSIVAGVLLGLALAIRFICP